MKTGVSNSQSNLIFDILVQACNPIFLVNIHLESRVAGNCNVRIVP